MKTFERDQLLNQLKSGAKELSLSLDAEQYEKLIDYLALLQKWNSVYNLTAVREASQMVTHHLLDSLAALPAFADVETVLDVGSGGGLPGMALAIARPDMQVSLIDAVQKKTAFLLQAKMELALDNVRVLTGRVEALPEAEQFSAITSRAFSDLPQFVSLTEKLLKAGGKFIAMKGAVPEVEIAQLLPAWKVTEIRQLTVPGLNAQRHLIIMQRCVS